MSKIFFLTGAPRSGTTFASHILKSISKIQYIHEPFDPRHGLIKSRYLYINPNHCDEKFDDLFRGLLSNQINYRSQPDPADSRFKSLLKLGFGSKATYEIILNRFFRKSDTTLIKDPVGFFLSEYLFVNHGVMPIILIRHPIGFVTSFKRLNWDTFVEKLLLQRSLIENYFDGEDKNIREGIGLGIITEASILWKCYHQFLIKIIQKYPHWIIIKHEDLSNQPKRTFMKIFEYMKFADAANLEKILPKYTESSSNKQPKKVHELKRTSKNILASNIRSLTMEERDQIFEITKNVALHVYDKESFQLK